MYKFKTGIISNKINNRIINNLRNGNHIQQFNTNDINFQGKWKNILNDITVLFAPKEFEDNKLLTGRSNKDNIQLFVNKDDIIKFLQNDIDVIEYVRRELLLLIEHEITHVIQTRKYPKSWNDNYIRNNGNDYREIEAITNEAIKLKKDYNLSFKLILYKFIDERNINKKLFSKKLYKKLYYCC